MSMVTTRPSDLGSEVAEFIRDTMRRATGGANVATYIEGDSPVEWKTLSEAGWDYVGVVEDDDSATLRDLVEIALAWGDTLIQLPLIPTIVAKRHSDAASAHEGPVTFSIHTQTVADGFGCIPFGQADGALVLESFENGAGGLAVASSEPEPYAASLRATVAPALTAFTDEVAYELKTVWAAEAAGVAKRVLADAVAFTKQREQFGRPIGSFQAVKHHLANSHVAAQIAETAAIWASLERKNADLAVRTSFEESLKSLQLSTQVYGGLGFTWEMGVHFALRHVTMLRELASGL